MTYYEINKLLSQHTTPSMLASNEFAVRFGHFSRRWVLPWLCWHSGAEHARVWAAYSACLDSHWRPVPLCRLLSALRLTPAEILRLCDPDAIVPYFAVRGIDLNCSAIYRTPGVIVTDEVAALIKTSDAYFRCAYNAELAAYEVTADAESRP